jgi:integrase/recombinase XerD
MSHSTSQDQEVSTDHISIVELTTAYKRLGRAMQKNNFSYNDAKKMFARLRQEYGFKRSITGKGVLPTLPSQKDVDAILKASEDNHTHWVMIQTLLTTGCRVSELINILIQDIYFDEHKIFIRAGKTGDRYVLFPPSLSVHFKALIQTRRSDQHLFISQRYKPYTRFAVSKLLDRCAAKCGIDKKIHPHLLRHLFCTRMSGVMSESEVMVLSGHAKKDTLAIYQHLSVDGLKYKYARVYS